MTHDAAMAVSHAREAAWNAASALDALAAALRRIDTAEALEHAIEAAGAARLAREWANELIGKPMTGAEPTAERGTVEVLVGYLVTHADGYEARIGPDRTRADLYAARNHATVEPMFVRRAAPPAGQIDAS